ncbi:MAG TPA: hypothetical protein VF796_03625, partial [Humisphaera sp.]
PAAAADAAPVTAPAATQPATKPAGETTVGYRHWAAFKPGSFTRLKGQLATDVGMKVEFELVASLVEIRPDRVVLEYVTTAFENGVAQKPEVAKQVAPAVNPNQTERLVGEEEVTVGDRKLKCKVYETTNVQPAAAKAPPITSRLWVSDEVPGGIVKSVTTQQGGTITLVLDECRAK